MRSSGKPARSKGGDAGPMLRFSEVTKTFPSGTKALGNVTLEVPRGQFCVVLGSSGAGKSTMLRCVTGLCEPTSGTVAVDGVVVKKQTRPPVSAAVATIHPHHHLIPPPSL